LPAETKKAVRVKTYGFFLSVEAKERQGQRNDLNIPKKVSECSKDSPGQLFAQGYYID
jgi:hypothetical protein